MRRITPLSKYLSLHTLLPSCTSPNITRLSNYYNNNNGLSHRYFSSSSSPQIIDSPSQHNIKGLNFQHQFMDEESQNKLLEELYTLNEHVWKVRNKQAEAIPGLKYDQFLVKNSDQFGRTVIHILLYIK